MLTVLQEAPKAVSEVAQAAPDVSSPKTPDIPSPKEAVKTAQQVSSHTEVCSSNLLEWRDLTVGLSPMG